MKASSWVALSTLIGQNVSLVLMMHASRRRAVLYDTGMAVLLAEIAKFLLSTLVLFIQTCKGQANWPSFKTFLQVMIPSMLYVVQNNLLYVALSNLEPFVFQVTYQLKIFTTAIFSVLLLKRKISLYKWGCLALLVAGVVLAHHKDTKGQAKNVSLGLTSVVFAAILSGFAGVYFEKILKGAQGGLWSNNMALSFWGIIFSLYPLIQSSSTDFMNLEGFTPFVWGIVLNQAFGGLLVAIVVKLTDNIAKAFATSLSIIVGGICQYLLYKTPITGSFLLGSLLVIAATAGYSSADLIRKSNK